VPWNLLTAEKGKGALAESAPFPYVRPLDLSPNFLQFRTLDILIRDFMMGPPGFEPGTNRL
jgi:hypothetical protein